MITLEVHRLLQETTRDPDLLLIDKRNDMYVLELTVGFEPNIEKNGKRKNL